MRFTISIFALALTVVYAAPTAEAAPAVALEERQGDYGMGVGLRSFYFPVQFS